MRGWHWLAAALLLLPGCETLNDSAVRVWYQDHALGRRVNSQIWEGLQKRESTPPMLGPKRPAPQFLDQG